jgi:glycosyltransferase involved in cell wall biosynthesis
MVGPFLSSLGGRQAVGEALAARLRLCGWNVLLTSEKKHRVARGADMVASAWALRHAYDVALVEVYSGAAFLWAEAVCAVLRLAGKPYVLTLHGGSLPEFASRWPKRVRNLLRNAQTVTSPSRYLIDQMRAYRNDIVLIPNALDIQSYPSRVRSSVRPSLVWLRAFHRIYRPELAPKILAEILKYDNSATLTMVGPDKKDGSFEKTVETAHSLGIEKHVRFPGLIPKPQVPSFLQGYDIFLNTTDIDNTPVSVIEAMACGLCVVSTNVGGVPYLLKDERDGLLVPRGDALRFAGAVERILKDPDLARRLSSRARQTAEAFDWTVSLPMWQSILEAAVCGGRSSLSERRVAAIAGQR